MSKRVNKVSKQQYLGTVRKAVLTKKVTHGFKVTAGNEEYFLPDEEVDESVELGDELTCFLYMNKKGEPAAVLELPEITRDSYGWAEVVDIYPGTGVFVDIGLPDKDILVSSDHLPLWKSVWPAIGDHLFLSLEMDKKGRLIGEPISEQEVMDDLEPAPAELLKEEVTARVYRAIKAGTAVLTGEGYRGFIHPHERKEEPRLGQTIQARVIDVKEDGTINLSLRPLKQESMSEDAEMIFQYLEENDGVMPLHDKSSPDEIRETFQISKAAFKRALGQLMKQEKIEQKDGQTVIKHG